LTCYDLVCYDVLQTKEPLVKYDVHIMENHSRKVTVTANSYEEAYDKALKRKLRRPSTFLCTDHEGSSIRRYDQDSYACLCQRFAHDDPKWCGPGEPDPWEHL